MTLQREPLRTANISLYFISFVLALIAVTGTSNKAVAQKNSPSVFTTDEEKRIKQLVLVTILQKPEILREASSILHKKEQEAKAASIKPVLKKRRDELERNKNAPVLGNPNGDVTVIEFFDYNCVYCKRAAETIKKLINADKNVRLVFREWPILSKSSTFAARAALASRKQGKYENMHWALMKLRRVNESTVLNVAKNQGLDLDRLRKDMKSSEVEAHIALSMKLARNLGITGTPTFVVGDALKPGIVPLTELRKLVAKARKNL